MKIALSILILSILGVSTLVAEPKPASALSALKQLPASAAERLAIIDGHDGSPSPDRWHFLVQDPVSDNGLREFVIENRKIVALRDVSQFAAQLTQADVVGRTALKVDSDAVGVLAQRYAAANGISVASMNFQLRKGPDAFLPVWTVSCLDEQGSMVATLMINATDGGVMAHDGFAIEPPPPSKTALRSNTKRAIASAANSRTREVRNNAGFRPPPAVLEGPEEDDRRANRRYDSERRERLRLPDPIQDVRRLIHHLLPF